MTGLIMLAAWLVGFAGAAVLYLAAPKQQALAKALPRGMAVFGVVLLVGAGLLFGQAISPATTAYSLCVLLMLAWTLGPFAVALLRRRRT